MKIARIIWWQLDSTLRPTMKGGFNIIPAQREVILLSIQIGSIKKPGSCRGDAPVPAGFLG
jgi:hypothetical protein